MTDWTWEDEQGWLAVTTVDEVNRANRVVGEPEISVHEFFSARRRVENIIEVIPNVPERVKGKNKRNRT